MSADRAANASRRMREGSRRNSVGRLITRRKGAARSRFSGDADGFVYWARVAPEVAGISSTAEMELSVIERIVEEERVRAKAAAGQ
jgi:hypothetical protein